MRQIVLTVFTALFFSLGLQAGASLPPSDYIFYGDDDHLPWPWGTECPFPWNDIEGMWKTSQPKTERNGEKSEDAVGLMASYYDFEIISVTSSGTKVVEITKYSQGGIIVGKGRGYAPAEQKIVRAVILPEPGVNKPTHRVIIRAYKQNATLSCGNELVTVLTTRGMNNKSENDKHYVLKKVPSEQ